MTDTVETVETLTKDQRIEMITEMRRLRGTGRPEVAAVILEALNSDTYSMGDGPGYVDKQTAASQPSRNDDTEIWREYVALVSDFDPEIIESTTKTDLIKMLEANGLMKRRTAEEMETAAKLKKQRQSRTAAEKKREAAAEKRAAKKKAAAKKKDDVNREVTAKAEKRMVESRKRMAKQNAELAAEDKAARDKRVKDEEAVEDKKAARNLSTKKKFDE